MRRAASGATVSAAIFPVFVRADEIDDGLSDEADAIEPLRLDDVEEHHVVDKAAKLGGIDIGAARHQPVAPLRLPILE
ncbi:MAG TPA: hypothetical protein VGF92_13495 [Stellaceae bacterium]